MGSSRWKRDAQHLCDQDKEISDNKCHSTLGQMKLAYEIRFEEFFFHLPLVDWIWLLTGYLHISTIYHWFTGFIYSQLIDMFLFHQPHPTIQRPKASQGDCVSAEIDAWAFAGRWESVVCMKPWTLQAYKTAKSIQEKVRRIMLFFDESEGIISESNYFFQVSLAGAFCVSCDLRPFDVRSGSFERSRCGSSWDPGIFHMCTFHAKGSAANPISHWNLSSNIMLLIIICLKYHQSMLTHHTLTFPRFLKAAYNYNCMLQVLPMTPLLACWLPVGEGKVLEERFVELQSSVALWWEVMGESCKGWW